MMRRSTVLLAACFVAAALAPTSSPGQLLPKERPERAGEPKRAAPVEPPDVVDEPVDDAPSEATPSTQESATGAAIPVPSPKPVTPQQPPASLAVTVAEPTEESACRERLEALGVMFKPLPPIVGAVGCGVAAPVAVSVLAPGVALIPEATMNCPVAEAMAGWTQKVAIPAASLHLRAKLTGVAHASTYVCRPRNNRPSGKLSEHATANAIDIASLIFEGRAPVAVVEDGGTAAEGERAFRAAIRAGACQHFTTVLGPGSDAAHASHYHFDLARRKSGYKLCQ